MYRKDRQRQRVGTLRSAKAWSGYAKQRHGIEWSDPTGNARAKLGIDSLRSGIDGK